ncbi:MAG: ABC transporter permease, partial [Thermoanaerobaculia bacterium]
LFTVLVFGVAPALLVGRLDPNAALKTSSRGATADRGHQRLRKVLIVGQFAFAMVLLAGAALYARGLHELNNRREGWESRHLVTGTIVLPATTYADGNAITDFQRRALERLEAIPGVASASLSYSMPFFGLDESRKFIAADLDVPEPGHEPVAMVNGVTPRYFETVGTPLLEGRTFGRSDTMDSPRVFVINEAMARGLFGNESAIGRRLAHAGNGDARDWGTIVGIVADIEGVGDDTNAIAWQLYHPMAQEPRNQSEIAVRTDGAAPEAMIGEIRSVFAALDPDLPVRKLRSADAAILRGNYQLGVLRTILAALALLGLGLACLGIYGVIARAMAERTREFGIRLALGARAADITRLVLGSGTKLALLGCTLGLGGALAILPILAMVSPNMDVYNVPVLAGVTLLLLVVAQIASWLPARNASRIDPNETLRAE